MAPAIDPMQNRSSLEVIQEKTFRKWLNSKLETREIPPMESLVKDLSDGVNLIILMEIMGQANLGRYVKNPKMRVQKAENVTTALNFIRSRGVHLTNIAAEDVIDGNLKLILGLIWTLILRFTIADISEEGLSAKDGLLLWVQRKTVDYKPIVDVENFTYSWIDGLPLCALIHRHRPDLLDFHSLDFDKAEENTELAFKVAQEHLGIPRLLDVADLCHARPPDERSVMTYVAAFFHAFSSMAKAETQSRRLETHAENSRSIWSSKNQYEERVKSFLDKIQQQEHLWETTELPKSYTSVKALSSNHAEYKKTTKRQMLSEKQDVFTLFSNIQTKLKTYHLKAYLPPKGHFPSDIDDKWNTFIDAEMTWAKSLINRLKELRDSIMRQFAESAEALHSDLHRIQIQISQLDGPLEGQQTTALTIQEQLPLVSAKLEGLLKVDEECQSANIEENEYTIHTADDLKWEFELLVNSLSAKIAFIENQIVARNHTNLTPGQLEEFEATFRHFDKDQTQSLEIEEFTAALASLSITFADEEIDAIFGQLTKEFGKVNFEAWIELLVELTEDSSSSEQLSIAFREVAGDKPYITELELEQAQLSQQSIRYLTTIIPSEELASEDGSSLNPKESRAYFYEEYLQEAFD